MAFPPPCSSEPAPSLRIDPSESAQGPNEAGPECHHSTQGPESLVPTSPSESEERQSAQASPSERLPDCAAPQETEGPRPRTLLARKASLSAPSSPTALSAPSSPTRRSPRPSVRGSALSPLSPLSPEGSPCLTARRDLQAFALGTSEWVDPNALEMELSISSAALRQRRVARRVQSGWESGSISGAESPAPLEEGGAGVTKTGRRAARSQRLQGLLEGMGRKDCPQTGQVKL